MLWLHIRTGSSESLLLANAISDKLAQFLSGSSPRLTRNAWNKTDSLKVESEYTKFRAEMRSWQTLVTASYSIRTLPIYKQSSVCHADTIHMLHVAYTEQSAH